MSVRAKFRCDKVSQTINGTEVEMSPVTGGIFNDTPCGELRLCPLNDFAAAQFAPGREYYVDFEAVPKAEPTPA